MTESIAFMQRAFELAQHAEKINEVPVGAVIVLNNSIIGEGFNQQITNNDPCAHAEIMALRAAGTASNNYRLPNCDVYVTLEPCAMCAGALVHARIRRLFFAAFEPKTGAVCSNFQLLNNTQLNHKVESIQGLMESECTNLLRNFFKNRRKVVENIR